MISYIMKVFTLSSSTAGFLDFVCFYYCIDCVRVLLLCFITFSVSVIIFVLNLPSCAAAKVAAQARPFLFFRFNAENEFSTLSAFLC